MLIAKAVGTGILTDKDLEELTSRALADINVQGKRVLAIIPDATRTAPVPLFFKRFSDHLGRKAKQLDYLIALGTHPPMSEERILSHLGISAQERQEKYGHISIFNHQWDQPEALTTVGSIAASEVSQISGELLDEDVAITLNRKVLDYDLVIIFGPVFPHEVVGFSGGNKYLFPGISGPEFLNLFHWLAALVGFANIIGIKDTPVRRLIDRAARLLELRCICFALVVTQEGVKGLFAGTPEEAWSKAADLSAKVHIIYHDRTYTRVLGVAPRLYDEVWTATKMVSKLEPILADGADLIIYAPHITEISRTHGHVLDGIGYHCRDYFLEQLDKFKGVPRVVLAHAIHVKGEGTFKEAIEAPRFNVILATGVSEERCRRINLGYRNPDNINLDDWKNREQEGILLVLQAGETLHRLRGC